MLAVKWHIKICPLHTLGEYWIKYEIMHCSCQGQHGLTISAVMTDDSTTKNIEEEMESIGVLSLDPGLEQFKDHFRYRVQRYVDQKQLIDKYEGGLQEFSKGAFKLCSTCL